MTTLVYVSLLFGLSDVEMLSSAHFSQTFPIYGIDISLETIRKGF